MDQFECNNIEIFLKAILNANLHKIDVALYRILILLIF